MVQLLKGLGFHNCLDVATHLMDDGYESLAYMPKWWPLKKCYYFRPGKYQDLDATIFIWSGDGRVELVFREGELAQVFTGE
jgi:hypothetical protein